MGREAENNSTAIVSYLQYNAGENHSDTFDYYAELPYMVNGNSKLAEASNIILIVVSAVGLLANLLSVSAILHIPRGKNTHSKVILSLAISDSGIAIQVFISGFLTRFSHQLVMSYCFWLIETVFINFALFATLLNILMMATDHYIAILNPLHYHEIMTSFRANCLLLVVWLLSVFGGLLDIVVSAFTKSSGLQLQDPDFCFLVIDDRFHAQTAPAFFVIIESVFLVILYARVFCEYRSFSTRSQIYPRRETHNKKAIITTGLIIGTFQVCWIPVTLYWIIDYYIVDVDNSLRIIIGPISYIMMVINTLCDPVIYALRLPTVRRGYKHLCRKLCGRAHHIAHINADIELRV